MCRTFDETFGELRVTQAYLELLSIAEEGSGTTMIPVVRTGIYEIRIFRLAQNGCNGAPAIWMELFDLGNKVSIDSSRCSAIEDARTVLKDFVAQVKSPWPGYWP